MGSHVVGGCTLLAFALTVGCARSLDVASPAESRAEPISATTQQSWDPVFNDVSGRTLRPADDPAAKAIVLIFVLPDCPICNAYIPELNRLHDEYAPRGAPVLLISEETEATPEKARDHVNEYKIQCPAVLDPQHTWAKRAEAKIAPEAAVFSASGELLYRGRIDDQYVALGKRRTVVTSHDLRDALEAILAGKPVPQPRSEAVGCPIPEMRR